MEEGDGAILFAGGHTYPGAYTNGVLAYEGPADADEILTRAERFFAGRRRGYAVWVREDVDRDLEQRARAAGMFLRPPEAGMPGLVRLEPLDDPPPLEGVTIEPVDDLEQARDYVRILASAYGLEGIPDELPRKMFFEPAVLLEPTVAAFLAYERDGQAVAAAMTIVAARMAGLYWSATLPAARGRGIADAALRTATNAGFARGAEFAGMQSSAMGESIWRRLGFWDARRYRRYLAPPAQAGSAQGAVTRTAETASGRP